MQEILIDLCHRFVIVIIISYFYSVKKDLLLFSEENTSLLINLLEVVICEKHLAWFQFVGRSL